MIRMKFTIIFLMIVSKLLIVFLIIKNKKKIYDYTLTTWGGQRDEGRDNFCLFLFL